MLTENIMHGCVVKLLRSNDEESYECLCKLLFTIGKDLDHEKAKVSDVSENFVSYDANRVLKWWHHKNDFVCVCVKLIFSEGPF